MKKAAAKKAETRVRRVHHRAAASSERPMEFGRSWQDLELQHDRLKTDWMSLAAQFGVGG